MPRNRLLASGVAVALSALVLTGCSGSDGSPLDEVKAGGTRTAPTLKVPKGLTVDTTTTRVLEPGSGPKIAANDVVTIDYVAYNGRTGTQFDDSFRQQSPLVFRVAKDKAPLPGFAKALLGSRGGAKLIAAIPPVDGFAADKPEIGLLKSDTIVFEFIVRNRLTHLAAWGTKQTAPADVPALVLKAGRPTGFTKSATTPAAPATSSAAVLVKGPGPKVKKGAVVIAQYEGHIFPAGAKFDSSWDRDVPSGFSLNGVVKCWKDLLAGVTVGSRVVLECTTADAYGDQPQPGGAIKPGDALIFVVDVLETYTY